MFLLCFLFLAYSFLHIQNCFSNFHFILTSQNNQGYVSYHIIVNFLVFHYCRFLISLLCVWIEIWNEFSCVKFAICPVTLCFKKIFHAHLIRHIPFYWEHRARVFTSTWSTVLSKCSVNLLLDCLDAFLSITKTVLLKFPMHVVFFRPRFPYLWT